MRSVSVRTQHACRALAGCDPPFDSFLARGRPIRHPINPADAAALVLVSIVFALNFPPVVRLR